MAEAEARRVMLDLHGGEDTQEDTQEDTTEDEDTEEDTQEDTERPDLSQYISAKQQLKSLNERRKQLLDTLKRSADEVEDYLLTSERKRMRIDGVMCEIKTSQYTPWNEKAIREFVDDDGKLDVDIYKSQATVTKQKLVMKVINE